MLFPSPVQHRLAILALNNIPFKIILFCLEEELTNFKEVQK